MMTSLDELKKKWFIDTADSGVFPPQVRHPRSLLQDHSVVRPLIDGVNIMGHFHDRVEQLLDVDNPGQSELWLAAMGIEQVQLQGMGPDDSSLAILVNDADWLAVQETVEPFDGEELAVELSPAAQAELKAIAGDQDVIAVTAEALEIEDGSE